MANLDGGIRMRVMIKLFATLREGRFKAETRELPEHASVQDVLASLNIKPEETAIILVDGRDAHPEQELQDGNVLSVFPPVGGG